MDTFETCVAGVGLLGTIGTGSWALFTWCYPSRKEFSDKTRTPNPTPAHEPTTKIPELAKSDSRLVELFGLLNERSRKDHRRFTEARFSEFLGSESLNLFEEIKQGKKSATRTQLEELASSIGVNADWLTGRREGYTGRAPFLIEGSLASGSSAILLLVKKLDVVAIHLTHCPEKNGESGVVVSLRDGRHIVIEWTVQLCGTPGGMQRMAMVDFDKLIGELMALARQCPWHMDGLILSSDDFTRLHSGMIYPPVVFSAPHDHMWYDLFHDTSRKEYGHVDLRARYGDYFIRAQDEVATVTQRQFEEWKNQTITLQMPLPIPEPKQTIPSNCPSEAIPNHTTMSHDIFISYSAKDSEVARQLQSHLKTQGLDVFLAEINIAPGADWKRSIIDGFKNSKWVFFLATPNSVASEAVMHELGGAMFTDKPFVALMHGIKPQHLPAWIQDRQAISLTDKERFSTLVRDIVAKIKANKDAGTVLLAGLAALALICIVSKEK